MDTSTESSKVVVDPEGDVILVVNITELQVSSKVLSVASDVFKAMFSPHFQEGQDLNSTSPKRISLPGDDAVAMTTLCNILHLRHNSVSKTPLETELVDLATVCDKYNCSEAFSIWSQIWMRYYTQEQDSDLKGVAQLLYPFFLLNDAESFKQVSKLTVFHTEGWIVKPKRTDLMPDTVFGKLTVRSIRILVWVGGLMSALTEVLRKKKQDIEHHLCRDLEIMVEPILNKHIHPGNLWSQHSNHFFCAGDSLRLSAHLRTLKGLGVWPLPSTFDDRSIASVCNILATYEEQRITGCACPTCSIDFQEKVRRAEIDAMLSFQGLCLACAKLGDLGTSIFRECHIHKAADVEGLSEG